MIHYDFPLEPERAKALIAKLNSEGCNVLCIFGCGKFGIEVAYTFLTEKLGLKISFFCDNNSKLYGKKITKDSIEVLAPVDLQKYAQKVVCFSCLSIKYQNDVLEQLGKMQIAHIIPLTPFLNSPFLPAYYPIPSFFKYQKSQIILNMMHGLGNQLWIYALYIVLKKRYPHRDIKIDTSYYDIDYVDESSPYNSLRGYKYALPQFFGINNIPILQENKYEKLQNEIAIVQNFKTFFYSINPPLETSDCSEILFLPKLNVYIKRSLFMNTCYMDKMMAKEQIRQTLNLGLEKNTVLSEHDRKILHEITNTNSVFIHVRREDIISSQKLAMEYDVARMDFYKSAIKITEQKIQNPRYFVFTSSDGLNYCKENFSFLKKAVFVAHDSKDVNIDLLLMSKCRHSIFAFSTLAWWAAFLNDYSTKVVVLGKYLFRGNPCWLENPSLPHWIKIDNLSYLFEETGVSIE
ncbi:MAG: alpha-1,2-fucosyltransferase [Fibromonadaceae bacterium]|jgi:hypothetical protein|nr:alpha-1,2-fucosyltransferase [Fibromonadaceae bacterium]